MRDLHSFTQYLSLSHSGSVAPACGVLVPHARMLAVSLQSCPTLCNPMDCSLPGFSVHGNSQTGILEWGAITFSSEASMEFNKVFLLHRGVSLPYRAPCFYFRAEKKMLESRSSESKPCSCVHRSYFLLKWSDFSISPKLHLRTCSGRHISLWKLAGLLRVPGQLGK